MAEGCEECGDTGYGFVMYIGKHPLAGQSGYKPCPKCSKRCPTCGEAVEEILEDGRCAYCIVRERHGSTG